MREELDKLYEEMKKEIEQIEINLDKDTLSNKSNKSYWEIEKKYKEKARQIRKKYEK